MEYTNYTNNTSITDNTSYILQKGLNTKRVLHSSLIQLVKNKYLSIHQDINDQLLSHLPQVKYFSNVVTMFGGVSFNDTLYLTDSGEIAFNHLSTLYLYKTYVYDITIIAEFTNGNAVYKLSITFDNYGKILYYENYSSVRISVGYQFKVDIPFISPGTITNDIFLQGIVNSTDTIYSDFTIHLIKTVDTLTRFKLKFIPGPTLVNGTYTFDTRIEKRIY